MPDESLILVERSDGVAIVTLNRPDAMNALSLALRRQLHRAITDIDGDDSIRAVILTGTGHRAFTAGVDLKELGSNPEAIALANSQEPSDNPVRAIGLCRKPVIGAINGVAITGGFELALACDILIASTTALFADTHVRVGIIPGWGLSQKLSRMVGIGRAKMLSLTGDFLDAQTAAQWGLVVKIVAPEDLMAEARRLAASITSVEPAMAMTYKELIDDGYALPFGDAMALEHARSSAMNGNVAPEEVEQRRAQVLARGRTQ